MKRFPIIALLTATCILSLYGCKAASGDKIDLGSTHTTAPVSTPAKESMAPTTAAVQTTAAETKKTVQSTTPAAEKNVSSKISTYNSGKVVIEYPVVSNLSDATRQSAINELLKSNALEIINSYELDDTKDALSVTCKVLSADRKRLTAVYSGTYSADGAPYPVNIFYSNTVDMSKGTSLGFHDYSDAYTMAGYVLSSDCTFYQAAPDREKELMEYKNTQTIETYTALFNQADFPLKAAADGQKATFPESFSYESGGLIYFSIPVPHALGDYALVTFTPDTK